MTDANEYSDAVELTWKDGCRDTLNILFLSSTAMKTAYSSKETTNGPKFELLNKNNQLLTI